MPFEQTAPLIFGIYPGSATGDAPGLLPGPADLPDEIKVALDKLQPEGVPFIVRCYQHYVGKGITSAETPANMTQYLQKGRQLELVLCYRTPDGDLADWAEYVRGVVRRYGPHLAKLQITEEPNNPDPVNGGDGSSPNVLPAIIEGVLAARDEALRLGFPIKLGFNATPSIPGNPFWSNLGALVKDNDAFLQALDYLGFDFFPDVFRPLPMGKDGKQINLEDAVYFVLKGFRETSQEVGNIPDTIPIHITENGWPTNRERSPERQAETLERIVRTVYQHRQELNLTHYEYFDLRDTHSASTDTFQFGLLRDDYSPKPAFEVYRRLITELGSGG
ncbi:MAG: hypothetical protein J0I20_10750 [Chloroflexi bacterium]|nr:hypothetical protein [Chloroflexota bacterium]OJV94441.1 MAG: hypothetical protein BGO39_22040 [Chloroflexi bacterium 54-19]